MSECLYKANKFSKNQAFDKVNKCELRRIIKKRLPRWVSKDLDENRVLRGNRRTHYRKIMDEMLHR